MDPMDSLKPEELLLFFRCNKTEISCLDKPQTLLSLLRDHNLIPEDRYKKVMRMKSKENLKQALYGVLDWLETERSQHIQLFWRCVFKESIMNIYPTLRILHNSLMDGSFQFSTPLPEKVEKQETNDKRGRQSSEDEEGEEEQTMTERKKRKRRTKRVCSEEEQAGPSTQLTPNLRGNSLKGTLSPLKRGEKNDIWTWAIYKIQLPVTCGEQKGFLNRDKLAKGERCIVVKNQWFTPSEFERFAGKERYKNWKKSIRCAATPLGKLIQDGHLKYKGHERRAKAKKSLFPPKGLSTVSDEDADEDEEANTSSTEKGSSTDTTVSDEDADEDEEANTSSTEKGSSTDTTDDDGDEEQQAEEEPECSHDNSKAVFKVTCGATAGTLHKKRFASGTCGKSIRTETSWMTPVEFVKEGSSQPDAYWKKDIHWEGKPLCALTKANILAIHSLLCKCRLCRPQCDDLENQKNDDECYVCRNAGEKLVMCDRCPRSFHQTCHLPHVVDAILGDGRPWACTFCVYRNNQECLHSDELSRAPALSSLISTSTMQCQYLLLFLYNADDEQIFATNTSRHVKGCTNAIKTPIWLDKVSEKLQNETYKTVGELVSDIQLIFANRASFNRDNTEFQTKGARLKELFERELKNIFSIQEETVD